MKPLNWQEGIGCEEDGGPPEWGADSHRCVVFLSLLSEAYDLCLCPHPSWEDHFEEQGELRLGH